MKKKDKPHLAATLRHIKPDTWRSTQQIAERHFLENGKRPTIRAVFNRLQELRPHVLRKKLGRVRFWRLAP